MRNSARVIEILLAGPSDIKRELRIARDVITAWNTAHSHTQNTFLEAVHWDTHAFPEIGDRAQALINKQLVDRCDLLIAIFWKTIGSSTGIAKSGTIEEIERFRKSGRPVMLYFSEAAVPHDADTNKLRQVRKYKASLQDTLYSVFKSRPQFKQKLTTDLAQVMSKLQEKTLDFTHSASVNFQDKFTTLNRIHAELETTQIVNNFPSVLEKLKPLLLDCVSLPNVTRIKEARRRFQYLIARVSGLQRFSFHSGTMAEYQARSDELFNDLHSAIVQAEAIEQLPEWDVARYDDLEAKRRKHTREMAWNWPGDKQCQCEDCKVFRALQLRIKDDVNPRFRSFILKLVKELPLMQSMVISSPNEIWRWIDEAHKTAKHFGEQFEINEQSQNAELAQRTTTAFREFAALGADERVNYEKTNFNRVFTILGAAVKTLQDVAGPWPEKLR